MELIFHHSGDHAPESAIHVGYLRDGIANAGDGQEFGPIDRDIRVVMFDHNQIDSSTVASDYSCPVVPDSRTAVFLVWRPDVDSTQSKAIGLEIGYRGGEGFNLGDIIESDDALKYLRESKMVIDANFPNLPRSEVVAGAHYFTELSVAGYRGFADKQVLRLAAPNGTRGSGMTVIVGANNSGKSTFLEALQAIARGRQQVETSFSQPRRHHTADFVSIELSRSDGRCLQVASTRRGSSQAQSKWSPENSGPGKFDIHVTPSRRQFSPYFGNTGSGDRNWGLLDQEFSRTQLREQFVGRLRKVDREPDARAIFDTLLKEIVGFDLNWTIDEIATGQQFLKLSETDQTWHTSEGLGDGLVSLLFIVDALYDSEPGALIAIDEPELSLHPQLIRRMGQVLSRFASNRQVVIATHSPQLISWEDVANGAAVVRVFKSNGRSQVAQATGDTLKAVAHLTDSNNLTNPHTVGIAAREAFFLEDGVILTEGQDDVAYLPRVLEDLKLPNMENVYGWGSGGVGNIPVLAQLFKELGFTRIGAILDTDNQPGTTASLEKLRGMGPEVLVRQIPAPDIRFKKAVKKKDAVSGLLEQDNIHVRPELRETAAASLADIIAHVSNDHP